MEDGSVHVLGYSLHTASLPHGLDDDPIHASTEQASHFY